MFFNPKMNLVGGKNEMSKLNIWIVQINHKEFHQAASTSMTHAKSSALMATLKLLEVGTVAPGQAKVCMFIPLVFEMAQSNSQR